MIDRMRFGQCLNNLLSNAAKFTEHGHIDVVVKLHAPANQAPQLAIAVRDNGIGMTKEQVEQVFTAYKQADETIATRFGGTGLGMSITKSLIELMGGKITLKSVPDKGTLFLILLPIKLADTGVTTDIFQSSSQTESLSAKIKETPPASQIKKTVIAEASEIKETQRQQTVVADLQPPKPEVVDKKSLTPSQRLMAKLDVKTTELEKLNVLVVDDNETNHIVMTSLLESVVGKIYSTYNGKEALNTLKIEHIDIVLMDIHMPIMDGIEATIAIRSNPDIYPDVRIIALTADPQYQQKRLCVNIGMDEAMAKPVKLVDLIETMKKTLANPINNLAKAS